jgi:hypothetical protein
LKLDLVQNAIPVGGFVARETAIPFPTLVGLAFGPLSGFAFSPEQLISWEMIDSKCRLTIHHINTFFVNRGDWDAAGRWLRISTFQGGHRVVLFETQSIFTDGSDVIPLYRGHQLYDRIDTGELLSSATAAADRVVAGCAEDGTLDLGIHEWVTIVDGINGMLQVAQAGMAMMALYRQTGSEEYLRCARRFADRLAGAIATYGPSRRSGCIVQSEYRDLDPNRIEQPRPIIALDTNALAICLFLEIDSAVSEAPFSRHIALLARYLVGQAIQPGGDFVVERAYPSMRLIPRTDVRCSALATLALVRLYEHFKRPAFLEAAGKSVDYLLTTKVEKQEMGDLPLEPALMDALDAYYTFERQDRVVLQVQRLALAAVAARVEEPDFSDMFGSPRQVRSATAAADHTRLLATATRILRDSGREEAALEILGEMWPGVVFQLQARVLPPTAMYLGAPGRTTGLFRDHLRGFGFDLRGQAAQIRSLLAARAELERAGMSEFPRPATLVERLTAARSLCNRFPRVLAPEMALPDTAGGSGPEPARRRPSLGPGPVIRPVPKR